MADQSSAKVGAVGTCFSLIEALAERGEAGVTELADATDISKGAAYKQLDTLVELGYATNEDGSYRLTFSFLDLACDRQYQHPLFRRGKEFVDDIARSTGAVASLVVVEDDCGVYLYRTGNRLFEAPHHEGQQCYLHATAGGKAILSQMETDRVNAILDRTGLPQLTEKTTTDRETLLSELRSVRERGLAFDRGEHADGWQGVASAVVPEDEPLGAVCVSGPNTHLHGKTLREDISGLLVSVTSDIEVAIHRAR